MSQHSNLLRTSNWRKYWRIIFSTIYSPCYSSPWACLCLSPLSSSAEPLQRASLCILDVYRKLNKCVSLGLAFQYRNNLSLASWTTQARPSWRFAPVMALHRIMCHLWLLIEASSNPWMWLAPSAFWTTSSFTYLLDLCFVHTSIYVGLIGKYQQARSGESLMTC